MPGVGKTLTVNSVMDKLKQDDQFRKRFSYYYFNAMNYPNPSNIYKGLLLKLFG